MDTGAGDPDAFEMVEDDAALDAPGLDAFEPDAPVGDDAGRDAASDAPGDAGPPPADVFTPPDAYSECDLDSDCMDDGNMCTNAACVGNLCTTTVRDCDDSVACTNDACSTTTGCLHIPDPAMCGPGESCDLTMGCVPADFCTSAAMCNDMLGCTTDACVSMACVNTPITCADDTSACTSPAVCNESTDACENPFDSTSLTDPTHCGTSASMCTAPCPTMGSNTVATCTAGTCGVTCAAGFFDVDGMSANGCEYACTFMSATDPIDPTPIDANCDGADGVVGGTPFIYVRHDGLSTGQGNTPATAVTIARGMMVANTLSGMGIPSQMLLASGTYAISGPLNAPGGLSMIGGYSTDYRSRSATMRSLVDSSASQAMILGSGGVTVDSVDFRTADQSSPGAYTRTLTVTTPAPVVLRNLTVTAGRGAAGSPGLAGTDVVGVAVDGAPGMDGTTTSGGTGGGSGAGAGGRGGTPPTGAGANGSGTSSCNTGGTGGAGTPFACICGGLSYTGTMGGVAASGCMGSMGMHGGGGSGLGSVSGGAWFPPSAGNGGDGGTGVRGSGGGGGGAATCTTGGQAAGGGGGGQGGMGGAGGGRGGSGGAGGGSFAILATGASLTLQTVTVATGGGGSGGSGGNGGMGGSGGGGGRGGQGGTTTVCAGTAVIGGSGSAGGMGGPGGPGGCGGGGAGGPSIGILGMSTTITPGASVSYSVGPGGSRGSACTMPAGGTPGGPGVMANQMLL